MGVVNVKKEKKKKGSKLLQITDAYSIQTVGAKSTNLFIFHVIQICSSSRHTQLNALTFQCATGPPSAC